MSSPAFIRTPPGLSNQAAFLGVDIVVFTESGPRTLSLTEVEQGLDNGETADSTFWRAVIEVYAPADKTFHVKTVGSKNTVRSIAALVFAGHVNKVVTSMDRDLDHYRGTISTHANILYTRGYSWENDLWTPDIVTSIFNTLVPEKKHRERAKIEITNFFQDFERCFRTLIRLDRTLASLGADPIPRETLKGAVRLSPPNKPAILRAELADAIKQIRQQNKGARPHPDMTELFRDLHGHTLAKASLALLQTLIQGISNQKVSNNVLTSIALTEFVRTPPKPSLAFYKVPVEQIIW